MATQEQMVRTPYELISQDPVNAAVKMKALGLRIGPPVATYPLHDNNETFRISYGSWMPDTPVDSRLLNNTSLVDHALDVVSGRFRRKNASHMRQVSNHAGVVELLGQFPHFEQFFPDFDPAQPRNTPYLDPAIFFRRYGQSTGEIGNLPLQISPAIIAFSDSRPPYFDAQVARFYVEIDNTYHEVECFNGRERVSGFLDHQCLNRQPLQHADGEPMHYRGKPGRRQKAVRKRPDRKAVEKLQGRPVLAFQVEGHEHLLGVVPYSRYVLKLDQRISLLESEFEDQRVA